MKLRWTPRDLWVPEQSIHKNTPYVMLAQLGFLAAQSKQTCQKRKRHEEEANQSINNGDVEVNNVSSV